MLINIICVVCAVIGIISLILDQIKLTKIQKEKNALDDLKHWCVEKNCNPDAFREIIKKYENIKKEGIKK